MSNKDLSVGALFIGKKSKNGQFFKFMMNSLIDEYLNWHMDYMPQDRPLITYKKQNSDDFKNNY